MKLSKDMPVLKYGINAFDWKFSAGNETKVAICVACNKGSDRDLYFDIVAELGYEEYLEVKHELEKIFGVNKVWTIGGQELGYLYPLLAYTES